LIRRGLTPTHGLVLFVLLALLVIGALGWVTITALQVEAAQLKASARADAANKERLALWQLDSRLFPTLGVETNRPYAHYFATYIPYPIVRPAGAGPDAEPIHVPSPLLSADLPDWMRLHFQVDAENGWTSPQVIEPELEARLRAQSNSLDVLSNATPQRRNLLEQLRVAFPKEDVLMTLFDRELSDLADPALGVPSPLTYPTIPTAPAADNAGTDATAMSMGTALPRAVQQPPLESRFGEEATKARRGVESGQQAGPVPPTETSPFMTTDQTVGKSFEAKQTAEATLPPANTFEARKATRDKVLQEVQGRAANDPTQFYLKPGPIQNTTSSEMARLESKKDIASRGLSPLSPMPSSSPPAPASLAATAAADGSSPLSGITRPVEPDAISPTVPEHQDRSSPETLNRPGHFATPSRPIEKTDSAQFQKKSATAPQADQLAQSDERFGRAVSPIDLPTHERMASEKRSLPHLQPPAVHLGPMRPQWLHAQDGTDYLIFVRVARLEDKTVFQGVVLDWSRLQEVLREEVRPIFPEARLEPVFAASDISERTMTALPARLEPGPAADPPPAGWTPLRLGLVIAWVAALVALIAVGFGGWSLIDLSERRIRFVSAVTHELRTPLTSLRLYLDLLTSGMIREEEKQREYLNILHGESERLNRLIENVLDFARLEKRSVQAHQHTMKLAELLDQVKQTWADRCAADGKDLVVISTLPPDQEVCTDPRMAAQILGNLIDNARKYTLGAADRRIWLWAKPGGRRIVLEVEDRGPGVPAAERYAIFRPFRRGQNADTTAGGAGLGLALAKQWAEVLGGSLTCRAAEGGIGACFRLELPVKHRQAANQSSG
jgi:signal transduction histidine kinase